MQQTETLTPPSDSPTTPPEGGLVPAAAPEAAPPDAQPKPGEEVTPPKADEPGAEPPKEEPPPAPPWATTDNVEALFEHEAVAPKFQERVDGAREEGQSDAQRRMQPLLQKQQESLQAIDGRLDKFVSGWNRMVKAGTMERDQIEELLDEHKDTFAALGGTHQELGRWAGANSLVYELAQALKSQEFTSEFQPRLAQLQRGLADPTLFEDMVKQIAKEATKPVKEQLAEATAKIERLETEARQAGRDTTKPPAEPPGKAAGGGLGQPRDEAEARTWHATGKWTSRQMREYQAAR